MKMTRNLIILGVVLVLTIALVVIAPKLKPNKPTPSPSATANTAELQLTSFTADKVSEVTVENAKQTYTMVKQGDKFVVKGQENLALDQTVANDLFFNVATVVGERVVEKDPKDLSIYGLDKPKATATAKYTDGTSAVFLLGDMTSAGSTYYLMKQGDNRVVTVWMNVATSYLNPVDAMLAKEKITLTQENVDTIKVVKKGAVVLEMTTLSEGKDVSISPWSIVTPWKRSVDATELDTYLKAVLAVQMGDIVEGNPADLAKYGLDNPTYDITISGKGTTNELLIGSDKDGSSTYAKFADSKIVYLVDKTTLAFTSTTAYKLMDKMILLVNIPSALGLEFNGLGQQGKMVIDQVPTLDDKGEKKLDSNGKQLYDQKFTIDGKAIDDKVARYFYQICIGLTTHSLVAEGWQPSGDPVAVLTYTRNTDPTTISIEFMAYDKDFYAVRMNGGTYFLIKQERVQEVADDMGKLKAGKLEVPKS